MRKAKIFGKILRIALVLVMIVVLLSLDAFVSQSQALAKEAIV